MQHAPLLGRHRAREAAHVLVLTGLHDHVVDAHLLHQGVQVGEPDDHADRPGEGSRIRVDLVGGDRDVVAPRRRDGAE